MLKSFPQNRQRSPSLRQYQPMNTETSFYNFCIHCINRAFRSAPPHGVSLCLSLYYRISFRSFWPMTERGLHVGEGPIKHCELNDGKLPTLRHRGKFYGLCNGFTADQSADSLRD